MDTQIVNAINIILICAVPLLLGIICHEVAHGYVAYRCGDPTAKVMGRLTLNPIGHIDPMGTAAFVLTAVGSSALGAPIAFGWAKPVPVDTRNLRKPRRDMALVAAAGPVTNFILAVLFMACLIMTNKFSMEYVGSTVYIFFYNMLYAGVRINLLLGIFNLLPIPPLDGSRLLTLTLPYEAARKYNEIGRYGMIIVLVLMFSGVFGKVLFPMVDWCFDNMLLLFSQIINLFA